jgi:hypothetical protein
MTIDLTPSEAKRIHIRAQDDISFYRDPVFFLGTQAELEAGLADWESIAAKCEAVIKDAGEWEAHAERVKRLVAGR